MNDLTTPICVLVVDDHTLFRRGLLALLALDERFRVGCEAADLGEALRCIADRQPDIILLDNHMPGVRGIDGIPSLKQAAPEARILMLTVSEEEDDLVNALRAGADGYLLKTSESSQLSESIIKVLTGESVVSPEMTSKLVAFLRNMPQSMPSGPSAADAATLFKELSEREREILLLIANGASNKVIARDLDIAETTVKKHVKHILRKLHMTSRVQAAVFAVHHEMA